VAKSKVSNCCFELRLGSDESMSSACVLINNLAYVDSIEDALAHFGNCLKAVIEQDDKYHSNCCTETKDRTKHNFCPICGRRIGAMDVFDQVCKLVQSLFTSSSVDLGSNWEIVMHNGWDIWAQSVSGEDWKNRRIVSNADLVIASILVDKLNIKVDEVDYLDSDTRKGLIEKVKP